MTDLLADLRQLAFPPALRIADPGPLPATLNPDGLRTLLRELAGDAPNSNGPGAPAIRAEGGLTHALAARLATAVWRIAKQAERLGDSGAGRAVRGKVELLTQILASEGIEAVDFSGRDFDYGDVWDKVVTSEERKAHPFIASMLFPRVLYRGSLIQAGTPVVEDRAACPHQGETP